MSALTPEGAPLTPEEQKTIARFLSDPFYFPLQFKTWLEWFIQGVQGNIAGGAGAAGGAAAITGIPIGGVLFTASGTLPSNCLRTDGSAYSRTAFNDLYREIGVTYGAGDGSTTFNVPDVQGRLVVGVGIHADVNAPNRNEGLPAGSRTVKHGHSFNLSIVDPADRDGSTKTGPSAPGSSTPQNPTIVGSIGVGPANDTAAFITLYGIIRYV